MLIKNEPLSLLQVVLVVMFLSYVLVIILKSTSFFVINGQKFNHWTNDLVPLFGPYQ